MKNLTFYIPTYNRVGNQVTYNNLPEEIQKRVILVVHPSESKLYGENHNLVVCPCDTIAAKREWIIKNCPTKYLVMLDDDLDFCRRIKPNEVKLKRINKTSEVSEMFSFVYEALKSGYVHVGVSPRGGNNHIEDVVVENSRMYGLLAYNKKVLIKNVVFNRVKFHEDFDINLQLLQKGFPNLVIAEFAIDSIIAKEGGCESERTIDNHNDSVERFAKLNHPYCRVVDKKYKTKNGDFSNRKELIVYWKKAFNSSLI